MNDTHFKAAVQQFEASPESLGTSGTKQLLVAAIERLEKCEATLMQMGWTHNDDKLFLALNLNDSQVAVLTNALDLVPSVAPFSIEVTLTEILSEWITQKERERCPKP